MNHDCEERARTDQNLGACMVYRMRRSGCMESQRMVVTWTGDQRRWRLDWVIGEI